MSTAPANPLHTLLLALATATAEALAPVVASGLTAAVGALKGYLAQHHPDATLEQAAHAADPARFETADPLARAAQDPEVVARAEAVLRAAELA